MTHQLNSVDKIKLLDAMREISASMARVEAERDLIKTAKDDICKDLQLNRKVFNKLVRAYHKGSYSEEVELHRDFEALYATLGTTAGQV